MVTQQKTQIKSRDTTDELSHKEFIEFLHISLIVILPDHLGKTFFTVQVV